MSKFKDNKFSKMIASFFVSETKDEVSLDEKVLDTNKNVLKVDINPQKKVWKKEYNPLRQIILWGWDESNNPSFLILYGRHKFENEGDTQKILADNVNYDSYAIFKGTEGHLPSFEAVKIIREDEDDDAEMYFKKEVYYNWGWCSDKDGEFKEFYNIEEEEQISFPYFILQSQEQYVQKINEKKMQLSGFKLAKNQNEVLNLDPSMSEFSEIIIDIMSKNNIYLNSTCIFY